MDTHVPASRPDGTPVPQVREGAATQYVAGVDRTAYDSVVATWTGPSPWVRVTPDGAREGALTAAGTAAVTSTAVGAATQEQP